MKVTIELDDDMLKEIRESNFEISRRIVKNFQATISDAIRSGQLVPEGITNGEKFLLEHENATIFEKEEERVKVVLDKTYDNHNPCAIFNRTWWDTPCETNYISKEHDHSNNKSSAKNAALYRTGNMNYLYIYESDNDRFLKGSIGMVGYYIYDSNGNMLDGGEYEYFEEKSFEDFVKDIIRANCYGISCSERSLTIRVENMYIVCPREGGIIKIDNDYSDLKVSLYVKDDNGVKEKTSISFNLSDKRIKPKIQSYNNSNYTY